MDQEGPNATCGIGPVLRPNKRTPTSGGPGGIRSDSVRGPLSSSLGSPAVGGAVKATLEPGRRLQSSKNGQRPGAGARFLIRAGLQVHVLFTTAGAVFGTCGAAKELATPPPQEGYQPAV